MDSYRVCTLGGLVTFLILLASSSGVILVEPDCPPEMPFVNCTTSPCDAQASCDTNPEAECVADYCGGCIARFYDDDGGEVHCEEEMHIICENKNNTIGCYEDGKVLNILFANYGRLSGEVCLHPYGLDRLHNDTNCRGADTTAIVKSLCQGERSCHIAANNVVFGDPCYGIYKYVEVDYTCEDLDASRAHILTNVNLVNTLSTLLYVTGCFISVLL
ncbi:L-rhamnose-binding lectin CSL1-like [Saccoglossus kowalevskii]|uniref:L-rhamnose-binding lectin CSL3-like n=1 Tax=Saccoglossus kowalevskii TaxID=10224 RepID=A0ABM0GZK5_SACKO|nr:PREDICTED: L-rhamnose-binding lectin CSL3-like [Saccoglossus kowalevskii]